ncbi:MAG: DUF4055 domain-containing protein [Thermoguttaceae bacterium]|jgi:hypothetical protein
MESEYELHAPLWEYVEDCYFGAERIKNGPNAEEYLPRHSLERDELRSGAVPFEESRYAFRRKVASFENFFRPVVDDVVGLMQRNPAQARFGIADDAESAPEVLELKDWGNRYNDGLPGLKARLNFAQILFGRYGMLLDVATDPDGLRPAFQIVEYSPRKILDGEVDDHAESPFTALRWALLDESTRLFDARTKEWRRETRRRLVALDGRGRYYTARFVGPDADAQWRAFDLDRPSGESVVYPSFKGATIPFVPLTVCNVERLGIAEWSRPPYLDLARLAVENYVVDSWYKMGLYFHATPTLAVCNATRESKNVRLGGVVWPRSAGAVPVTVSILETSGAGLAELRNAKSELRDTLRYTSIRDLVERSGANSSSESLRIRTTTGSASIAAIDRTGARAIEEQLCFASLWSGASLDETRRRIAYTADVSYLGAEVRLDSVVELLRTNRETNTLSDRSAYAFLEKAAPGVLPSYEDNEEQKSD